jgi:hypothetical protein
MTDYRLGAQNTGSATVTDCGFPAFSFSNQLFSAFNLSRSLLITLFISDFPVCASRPSRLKTVALGKP